ncbi:TetR/AcrR family transcriptional regulator [Quadrisphaera granulorum]|uniref:TetR/AcrR family transcriptional regulator n=1 Tax=Quadrisphaera granulorum TaxID=317664 RepID=UPI003CCC58CA
MTRERALSAATALADAEGTDAVTMRRLAGELDVVPMALYRHVAGKDDLMAGLVDAMISRFAAPAPGLPWKEAVRSHALSARAVLQQHPWLRRLIETSTVRSPAVLSHLDRVAGAFMAGGVSADLTHHAMHLLGHRVWGFSPEAFTAPPPSVSGGLPEPAAAPSAAEVAAFSAQYPHIVAIALAATGGDLTTVGQGCDEDFEFSFALDLVLDAVERLHEAGWPSRRS